MKSYKKEVEVFFNGAVVARVIDNEDRCVGSKIFCSGIFDREGTVRKRCEKAHKWANGRILTCQEYEVHK